MVARGWRRAHRRARGAARVALAGGLVVSMAACTAESEPGADPTSTPSPTMVTSEPAGPLEIAVYGTAAQVRAYEEIVEAFAAVNPSVDVDLSTYRRAGAARKAALTALREGTGPDVFLADSGHLPDLLATRGLQPVDTMLEERDLEFGDDFQRLGLTAFSANARLQCMPAEVSPLVLYYNRELVRTSQPQEPIILPNARDQSWDWEEFELVARATAGQDQLGPVTGAWFPRDTETLAAFVRSNRGDIVDDVLDPTSLTLTSEEALSVVETLASFARDPAVSPPDGQGASDPVRLFTEGRLGMLVGTRADLPRLRAAEELRFGVLPLPSFGRLRSVSYLTGWCVNGATEEAGLAGDFLAFAVGPEAAAIASRSGAIVPSRLDAVHSRAFIQPRRQPANAFFYASGIRRSDPMPMADAWPEVSGLVEEQLSELYSDASIDLGTLERRMERLNARSTRLLGPPVE